MSHLSDNGLILCPDDFARLAEALREDLMGCRLELEADPYNEDVRRRLDQGREIMGRIAQYVVIKKWEEELYDYTGMEARPELN